ncbi:MAG: type II CAAX endopeptidase family protein [Leptolyngbya sp.]|nr:type II CAAX endopeptidase family protein [Leptolyngbya sp.]
MADSDPRATGLSLKRLALIVVTALVSLVLVQSLWNSLTEPQVASQLQLYQTDLLLESSAWDGAGLPPDQWPLLRQGLLGDDPLAAAQKQYESVRQEAAALAQEAPPLPANLGESTNDGKPLPRRQQTALAQQQSLVAELDLRLGLMAAAQANLPAALDRWNQVRTSETAPAPLVRTANTLTRLWQEETALPEDEPWLRQALKGWFATRALEQLYRVEQREGDRQQLLDQEQLTAQDQLVKLAIVGTLPVLGAVLGVGIILGLGIQWLLKGDRSLLRRPTGLEWVIPWDGETIWQVLMVGFFFVGQILLPLLLGGLGLSSAALSSRGRAIFSLTYYLLMSAGGLGVLWLSVRPYRPLSEGLFRIRLSRSGLLWGVGGYLVALPLMLLVAVVNQQIWQGQGGSNPLLQTVLEEQDPVALIVFFATAAIAAPLFEETLFRGFLLPSLTKYMTAGWAVGLSGLIFAAAHLSLSEVLPLTLLGCILGGIYSRSRNLLSPMLLHSLWNSATMLGLFILGG